MSHGSGSRSSESVEQTMLMAKAGAPPAPPSDAPFEEREAYWLKWVYQGDSIPQLTLRAVLMGGVLGMLMSVSNLYTTLKIGWAFGVVVTACVMSFVIWNFLRLISGNRLSQMSILENACMASTASAAGYSTGSTIATMFGALLIIESDKLPDPTVMRNLDVFPWHWVAAFTFGTAALGVFLAIPTKRQMINREQLAFPTGIAAATTLRSLYSEGKEAVRQAYALVAALFAGALIGIFNTGGGSFKNAVPEGGTLPSFFNWIDTRIFGHFKDLYPEHGLAQVTSTGTLIAASGPPGADTAQPKGLPAFGLEVSGLLVAAGMLMGSRAAFSMLFGSALLYLVVGPWLISVDHANAAVEGYLRSIEMNKAGTVFRLTTWSLWGGTALMVASSLTAVALQWRTVARAFTGLGRGGGAGGGAAESGGGITSLEVPAKWFVIGMIPITIVMVFIQAVAFDIHWFWGTVAVALSFVLSLVASRATGETDTTPIGAMGKVMQLLFAVVHPGQIIPNLASAGVAANGASASADLLTDLKCGYMLGANPRRQFIAQFIGIFFGTLAIVPAWYLMVPDRKTLDTFALPSTQQWVAVAKLLTEGIDKLPMSARYAILIGGLLGVALPIIDRLAPRKLRPYLPSSMGLGLSWVIPFSSAAPFAIGAVIAIVWQTFAKGWRQYIVPVASGLIAGEGLMKAIIAMTATVLGLLSK